MATRYWRAVEGDGRMILSGTDDFEPDPDDWRPATAREAVKDYLTTPRFSWVEFFGLVIVGLVFSYIIRWLVAG